jgi:hypothetical protein
MSQPELLAAIASVQNLFYNYTGAAGSCNNPAAEEGNGTGGFAAGDTWPYQTCTEQVLPVGQYGLPSDMFYVAPWTQQGWDASCQQQFGTTTRPNWILESFGDAAGFARSAGNIVFSNGDRDPWSGGGVLEDINASIVYNPVVGGAHHYDLRATNPADTPGVLTARQIHAEFIQHWVEQARAESRAVKKGDRKKKRAQKVLTEQ